VLQYSLRKSRSPSIRIKEKGVRTGRRRLHTPLRFSVCCVRCGVCRSRSTVVCTLSYCCYLTAGRAQADSGVLELSPSTGARQTTMCVGHRMLSVLTHACMAQPPVAPYSCASVTCGFLRFSNDCHCDCHKSISAAGGRAACDDALTRTAASASLSPTCIWRHAGVHDRAGDASVQRQGAHLEAALALACPAFADRTLILE
jgi:hypothetical protein